MVQLAGKIRRIGRMLFQTILPGGALLVLAASLLTAVRVPTAVNWRVAVVVSELGYALTLVPLTVGCVAWTGYAQAPNLTWVTLAASSGALVLLLKPAAQAWRIGRELPGRLTAAFGPAPVPAPAFALRRLTFRPQPAGPVTTHEFAPGLSLDLYPAVDAHRRGFGLLPGIVRDLPGDGHAAGLDPGARLPPAAVAEVGEELVEPAHGRTEAGRRPSTRRK